MGAGGGGVDVSTKAHGQLQAQGIAPSEIFRSLQMYANDGHQSPSVSPGKEQLGEGGMLTSVIGGPRCKMNACDSYPPLIISGLICQTGTKSKMSIKKGGGRKRKSPAVLLLCRCLLAKQATELETRTTSPLPCHSHLLPCPPPLTTRPLLCLHLTSSPFRSPLFHSLPHLSSSPSLLLH